MKGKAMEEKADNPVNNLKAELPDRTEDSQKYMQIDQADDSTLREVIEIKHDTPDLSIHTTEENEKTDLSNKDMLFSGTECLSNEEPLGEADVKVQQAKSQGTGIRVDKDLPTEFKMVELEGVQYEVIDEQQIMECQSYNALEIFHINSSKPRSNVDLSREKDVTVCTELTGSEKQLSTPKTKTGEVTTKHLETEEGCGKDIKKLAHQGSVTEPRDIHSTDIHQGKCYLKENEDIVMRLKVLTQILSDELKKHGADGHQLDFAIDQNGEYISNSHHKESSLPIEGDISTEAKKLDVIQSLELNTVAFLRLKNFQESTIQELRVWLKDEVQKRVEGEDKKKELEKSLEELQLKYEVAKEEIRVLDEVRSQNEAKLKEQHEKRNIKCLHTLRNNCNELEALLEKSQQENEVSKSELVLFQHLLEEKTHEFLQLGGEKDELAMRLKIWEKMCKEKIEAFEALKIKVMALEYDRSKLKDELVKERAETSALKNPRRETLNPAESSKNYVKQERVLNAKIQDLIVEKDDLQLRLNIQSDEMWLLYTRLQELESCLMQCQREKDRDREEVSILQQTQKEQALEVTELRKEIWELMGRNVVLQNAYKEKEKVVHELIEKLTMIENERDNLSSELENIRKEKADLEGTTREFTRQARNTRTNSLQERLTLVMYREKKNGAKFEQYQ